VISNIKCGHKTFGVKWLFEHPATHQLFATVDTNAARSPKRFIPQNRWQQARETDNIETLIKLLSLYKE